jgi:hypothetical protein
MRRYSSLYSGTHKVSFNWEFGASFEWDIFFVGFTRGLLCRSNNIAKIYYNITESGVSTRSEMSKD